MNGRNEAGTPVSRLTDKLFTCDLITFMKAGLALTLTGGRDEEHLFYVRW